MINGVMLSTFLAVLVFSLLNGAWILHRLQLAHRAVWDELGQPTATMSSGVLPRLALVRYIWRLRFRALGDAPLSLACWAALLAELALIVLFPLLVLGAISA
ncbi:MAG: hypothetical protein QMD17_11195 [Rhodocyclaceae bacterium]|jgi:hypothetical protein|nr:hypothetical protein [Rhodocyclaceae bacterium]